MAKRNDKATRRSFLGDLLSGAAGVWVAATGAAAALGGSGCPGPVTKYGGPPEPQPPLQPAKPPTSQPVTPAKPPVAKYGGPPQRAKPLEPRNTPKYGVKPRTQLHPPPTVAGSVERAGDKKPKKPRDVSKPKYGVQRPKPKPVPKPKYGIRRPPRRSKYGIRRPRKPTL